MTILEHPKMEYKSNNLWRREWVIIKRRRQLVPNLNKGEKITHFKFDQCNYQKKKNFLINCHFDHLSFIFVIWSFKFTFDVKPQKWSFPPICGRMRIQEQGQMRGGQYQKNRPRKVLTTNLWGENNNSPQAQGDYNTWGPRGYYHVLGRAEAQFGRPSGTNRGRKGRFVVEQ